MEFQANSNSQASSSAQSTTIPTALCITCTYPISPLRSMMSTCYALFKQRLCFLTRECWDVCDALRPQPFSVRLLSQQSGRLKAAVPLSPSRRHASNYGGVDRRARSATSAVNMASFNSVSAYLRAIVHHWQYNRRRAPSLYRTSRRQLVCIKYLAQCGLKAFGWCYLHRHVHNSRRRAHMFL